MQLLRASSLGFFYDLSIYIILLLISSTNVYFTIIVNTITFVFVFSLKMRQNKRKFTMYTLLISIGNFITFEIFVTSYAKILFWEHILHITFYLLVFWFYYSMSKRQSHEYSFYNKIK
jgi:hypothetical protein